MTKRFLLALSLMSLLGVGCGKSACEESFDIAVDCGGATEANRDVTVAFCEALPQAEVEACLDCTNGAADPCTATDPGGPCEAACNIEL